MEAGHDVTRCSDQNANHDAWKKREAMDAQVRRLGDHAIRMLDALTQDGALITRQAYPTYHPAIRKLVQEWRTALALSPKEAA